MVRLDEAQGQVADDAAPAAERLSPLAWLVLPFILGVTTVQPLDYWNYVVKALGLALAVAFVIGAFRRGLRPSPEVWLYWAWILWCLLGGLLARSPFFFWQKWGTVFQIGMVILILSEFTSSRKALSFNLACLLIGAAIVGAYSLYTGEYSETDTTRLGEAGMTLNSNALANLMVLTTVALAYFWMKPPHRAWKYAFLLAAMIGAAFSTALSVSRTGIASLGVFYLLWIWYCYRAELLRRPAVLVAVLLGLCLGGYAYLSLTLSGQGAERWNSLWRGTVGGEVSYGSVEAHIQLWKQGIEVFIINPILGVGLNNYRVHNTMNLIAHTEYIEIVTDTGLVGMALYFPWYVILYRRAGRIRRYSPDPMEQRTAALIRASLIALLFNNISGYVYDNKYAWILLAGFIGYTQRVWGRIQAESAELAASAEPSAGGVGPASLESSE